MNNKKALLEMINANRDKVIAEMKRKAQENPNMDPALREAIGKIRTNGA